jgi:hypothetical protein
VRGEPGIGEDRTKLLDCEAILEVVAPHERRLVVAPELLRLATRCSGRVDIEGQVGHVRPPS